MSARHVFQPTSSPVPSSSGPSATGASGPNGTETVARPDPGLARGRWEAPAWAFWAVLAVALVATVLYVLRRMGILRLPPKKSSPQ